MVKRWIGRAAAWAGLRGSAAPDTPGALDERLERDIAASLTDEALAWAVGTWRKRYL
ncbi:hypothetical protein QRB38_20005 [Mycobacterium avium subsp. hominissuis]|uniref:hypothetical protein n=1 Tax=Mycobacterium avium TaxID=1764 RepID=UPI0026671F44|nr:hypothetical protein [Mycobacterium avium]MDO2396061.1 hypothetical protein [Mycobacterium avium subsp. hominissuis]